MHSSCIQAANGIFRKSVLEEMQVCLGPDTACEYDPEVGTLFEQGTTMWILVAGHTA